MTHKIGILGCGWLGFPLAQQLVNLGFDVKGTTTSEAKMESLQHVGIAPYKIDLNKLEAATLDCFLQDIALLIITIPPIRNEVTPTYAANFAKLLPYLTKHNIQKVIMMSSVSLYAPSKLTVTEDSLAYSMEQTAQQILAAEQVLLTAHSINTYILRLGGLFGNDREPVRYICAKDTLENPQLSINMIHLDDIIQFTTALIQEDITTSSVFNIVSPNYKNRIDYYTKRAQACNLTLPPNGDTNTEIEKKVSGNKIAKHTKLTYRY